VLNKKYDREVEIMNYICDKEFEKYIENKTCRGCANHCKLLNPNCNRSKIFIKDEYEKYINQKCN
jgi:hypothetical protein